MKITRRGAVKVGAWSAAVFTCVAVFSSAVYAASSSPSSKASPSPSPSGHPGPGHDQPGFGGPGGFGALAGGGGGFGGGLVVHGQDTVRTKTGYQTIDFQVGAVTAKSGNTLTVTSTDGYKLVWTLNSKTVIRDLGKAVTASALKTGQTIRISGTATGAGATARIVQVRPPAGTWPGLKPKPSPSPTASA
jgi:hypothetical protein